MTCSQKLCQLDQQETGNIRVWKCVAKVSYPSSGRIFAGFCFPYLGTDIWKLRRLCQRSAAPETVMPKLDWPRTAVAFIPPATEPVLHSTHYARNESFWRHDTFADTMGHYLIKKWKKKCVTHTNSCVWHIQTHVCDTYNGTHARDMSDPWCWKDRSAWNTSCSAVCCSVLQCVAVCCSVLQCVAVCYSVTSTAVCCSVLQCLAV